MDVCAEVDERRRNKKSGTTTNQWKWPKKNIGEGNVD